MYITSFMSQSPTVCFLVVAPWLTPGCAATLHTHRPTHPPAGNIIGQTQTLTLFVESAYKEYNSEAAFAAAVLLSLLALATLWVKDKVEAAAAAEAAR